MKLFLQAGALYRPANKPARDHRQNREPRDLLPEPGQKVPDEPDRRPGGGFGPMAG